jgi:hypothetical protein
MIVASQNAVFWQPDNRQLLLRPHESDLPVSISPAWRHTPGWAGNKGPGPLQQFWDDLKAHHGIKLVVDKGQNATHMHVILNLTKRNDLCFHMYCSFLKVCLFPILHGQEIQHTDTMLCKSVAFWPLIFRGVPEKWSRKSESLEEISSQCETSGSHGGMEIRAFWDVVPCSRSRQTFQRSLLPPSSGRWNIHRPDDGGSSSQMSV